MSTLLPDKDAPLEETLRRVNKIFAEITLAVDIVSELQPLSSCWSHRIQLQQSPVLATNGKGESKKASLVSGFAEMVERFATGFLFSDYALLREKNFYFHPKERRVTALEPQKPIQQQKSARALLTPELFEFYDPERELLASHLMDSNFDDLARGILALPFTPLTAAEQTAAVYFPVALLENLYVSNGMAAGNSRWECLNQAISEIFERHVKYTVISEAVALPDFPGEYIEKYPLIVEKCREIEKTGCSLWLKDASLGGQFPVVCALLLDPAGRAFASFGCSCHLEVALARSLTEMMQGKKLDQLRGFSWPETCQQSYASSFNLENHFINSSGSVPLRLFCDTADISFSSGCWDFTGDSSKEFAYLCKLVEQAGYYGYRMEFSQLGMPVCRVVIPGMSEIYSPDELLWNNRNKGSWIRPVLLALPQLGKEELVNFISLLEESGLAAEQLCSALIGIVFDKESVWAGLRLGELRAMLHLAIVGGDDLSGSEKERHLQEAKNWCHWVVALGTLDIKRHRIYLLLEYLLALCQEKTKISAYDSFLLSSFSREELGIGEDIIEGRIRFWGLNFGCSWQSISCRYDAILKTFSKYQQTFDR